MCSDSKIRTDEELCVLAQSGAADAEHELAVRYARVVRMCARPYFLKGGDMEDLIQEGMFALVKAVRDYSPLNGASFSAYAGACIRNGIYSAIRSAARDKHSPLNDYVPIEDGKELPVMDGDPEEAVISSEKQAEFEEKLKKLLSAFENEVLTLYLDGWHYDEIAEKLGKTSKSVDNAVQRIRRKITRA